MVDGAFRLSKDICEIDGCQNAKKHFSFFLLMLFKKHAIKKNLCISHARGHERLLKTELKEYIIYRKFMCFQDLQSIFHFISN